MSDNAFCRIGSYNLRCPCDPPPYDWTSRAPRVIANLHAIKYDIFGVQEAVDTQIATILQNTRYQSIGVGRDAHLAGEYSCIFYDPARFTNIGQNTFWLSSTPEVPASKSWNTACPRICTYGTFLDKLTGKIFVFANTHLDHVSPQAQLNGIKLIVKRLKAIPGKFPVVLTGDFNAFPDSSPIAEISRYLRQARAVSETPHRGPAHETYHGYVPPTLPRAHTAPIDYIWVSETVRVLAHEAQDDFKDGYFASDHYALMAEVQF